MFPHSSVVLIWRLALPKRTKTSISAGEKNFKSRQEPTGYVLVKMENKGVWKQCFTIQKTH